MATTKNTSKHAAALARAVKKKDGKGMWAAVCGGWSDRAARGAALALVMGLDDEEDGGAKVDEQRGADILRALVDGAGSEEAAAWQVVVAMGAEWEEWRAPVFRALIDTFDEDVEEGGVSQAFRDVVWACGANDGDMLAALISNEQEARVVVEYALEKWLGSSRDDDLVFALEKHLGFSWH